MSHKDIEKMVLFSYTTAFSLFHSITHLYHLIPLIEIQLCSLSEKLQFIIEIIVGGL